MTQRNQHHQAAPNPIDACACGAPVEIFGTFDAGALLGEAVVHATKCRPECTGKVESKR